MKQLAIIGPTASGKSDLALEVANKIDAYILSIDSLSIYKEIDIVSAKPSKEELAQIRHFGINELYPNEHFNVEIFIKLYKQTLVKCEKESKNLVIVGGTSFYLKSLLQGLSEIPQMDEYTKQKVKQKLTNLQACYDELYSVDKAYMNSIAVNDRYRIEKALLIYEASNMTPTQWFKANPPKPIIENLDIYNIDVARDILRQRINIRTNKMVEMGLIDEICYLEQKYSRLPNSMGAIGIVEVLEYLDGKISKTEMIQKVALNTAHLAKRQQTFNNNQFHNVTSFEKEKLPQIIFNKY
jgi:tRNA dimethylallyltransferase